MSECGSSNICIQDTELLGEGVLPTLRHALEKLSEPDCMVIPSQADIICFAMESEILSPGHWACCWPQLICSFSWFLERLLPRYHLFSGWKSNFSFKRSSECHELSDVYDDRRICVRGQTAVESRSFCMLITRSKTIMSLFREEENVWVSRVFVFPSISRRFMSRGSTTVQDDLSSCISL